MDRKQEPVQPAVWLIITGSLNAALGLFCVVGGLIQINNPANSPVAVSEAERIGYYTGQFAAIFVFLLGLVSAPVIIYGAVKMFNGSSYRWAKAASILALIPFTSCCLLIGAPVGIWAFGVLSSLKVKMFIGCGSANKRRHRSVQCYS